MGTDLALMTMLIKADDLPCHIVSIIGVSETWRWLLFAYPYHFDSKCVGFFKKDFIFSSTCEVHKFVITLLTWKQDYLKFRSRNCIL